MRIVQVHSRYIERGGEEVAVEAEAALLRARGHQVVQLYAENRDLLDRSKWSQGVGTVWNAASRSWLSRNLADIKPDVVHFHNTFPALSPAVLYAVPRHTRVIQTLHNYRLLCVSGMLMRAGRPCELCVGNLPWRGVMYRCYRDSTLASSAVAAMITTHRVLGSWNRVDTFIALSAFAARTLIRGGLPVDRMVVKPNHLEPDPGIGRHTGENYLFVGRLSEQKGVRTLLDAWRLLRERPPLTIIGQGELEAEVREAAAAMPEVSWLGGQPRNRVLDEMKNARALVFPSLSYEVSPFTVVEAFATGLPVLASGLENVAEIVGQNNAGRLFQCGTAADLARCVSEIEREPNTWLALGAEARRRFEQHYTGDAAYAALIGAYTRARDGINADVVAHEC